MNFLIYLIMDIFEFELRWLAYKWLFEKFNLPYKEEDILNLVKISDKWKLEKKLTETSPDELRQITLQTYTKYKKEFIEKNKDNKIKWDFSLSDYVERLEYELKVIKEMWYNTYFLIVQDYINWAKNNKIAVGPGRGSAAGSLLAYLIWITDLDPLEYDLLFERFLNPARVSMPDIDTDFEDIKRDDLIEYVKEKYWKEKVALIWTYMSMAAKAAFKDVARTMWMPFEQANKITELITEKSISESLEKNEAFKELVESDDDIKKIVGYASQLEWTIRQTWVHACWVIISPEPVVEYTPVQYPLVWWWKTQRDTTRIVTQYDGHYLEDIWLLKMDFLWLRNLYIIKNTIKIIRARIKSDNSYRDTLESKWIKLDFVDEYFKTMWFYPPLDDIYVYETIFQKGNTSWVFQFESDWMRRWLVQLRPTNINDIIAMVALYRPGPMDFIPNYIARKYWEEKIEYLPKEIYDELVKKYWKEVADEERKKITQDLSPFMEVTYGIPIYQEQLMRIVQAMAWFSLGEADLLRRWVWKKIKEIIEKLKKEFIERAEQYKWYKPETSKYVYEKMIEPAANYSFNKSHAACYAFIAYQTAWLKAHFPLEFHASLLRSVEEDTDKLSKFIDELKLSWFEVLPPDINKSFAHVAAVDNSILLWFLSIKWLGYEVAKHIEEEREKNGKYKNLEDFLKRNKDYINKKTLEALAKSWALDIFENRKTILENIDNILNWLKNSQQISESVWLFGMDQLDIWLKLNKKDESLMDKLKLEYEIYKTFVSAHPFDGLFDYIKWKYNFISMFKEVEDYWEFNIIWVVKDIRKIRKKWVWIDLEDITWTISLFLKDNFDIKKFDIIAVNGYKGKSSIPRVNIIMKIDLNSLIDKAKKNNKFKKENSVFVIRARRVWSNNFNWLEVEKNNLCETSNCETNFEKIFVSDNIDNFLIDKDNISTNENSIDSFLDLSIPEDIEKIKKICYLINNCVEGDCKIYLNGKEFLLSENDIKEVKKLCGYEDI